MPPEESTTPVIQTMPHEAPEPTMPETPGALAKRPPMALAVLSVALLALVAGSGVAIERYAAARQVAAQAAAAAVANTPDPFSEVSLIADAAFVLDTTTGEVLYTKNASQQLPLASVTKLMLGLVASEVLSPNTVITISEHALATEGDSGLVAGEQWHFQDLLDFTLIESSNDGAVAIADAIGPDVLARMNTRARELGLTQTYYLSPSGLDASDTMAGAYGSAHDMALLLRHIVQNATPAFTGTTFTSRSFTSLSGIAHTAHTTNNSLGTIPGLIAGKTGYTDLAGGNLVVAFDAGLGHPIVVVVLHSTVEGRFRDVEQLVAATHKKLTQ